MLATVLRSVVSAGAPPTAATMRWAARERRIAEVNLRNTVDAYTILLVRGSLVRVMYERKKF